MGSKQGVCPTLTSLRLLTEQRGSVPASNGCYLLHLGFTRRTFRWGREGELLRWLARSIDELLEARGRRMNNSLAGPESTV
jgi:hypothetical protein